MPKPKLTYRRAQLAAMKKLLRYYKKKKNLSSCPLCHVQNEFNEKRGMFSCEINSCNICVWVIETGQECRDNMSYIRMNPNDHLEGVRRRITELTEWIKKYDY